MLVLLPKYHASRPPESLFRSRQLRSMSRAGWDVLRGRRFQMEPGPIPTRSKPARRRFPILTPAGSGVYPATPPIAVFNDGKFFFRTDTLLAHFLRANSTMSLVIIASAKNTEHTTARFAAAARPGRHVTAKTCLYSILHLALALAAMLAVSNSATAEELEPKTIAVFNHYIALSETTNDASLNDTQSFLWVNRLPPEARAAVLARLRAGNVVIERMQTLENGKPIDVPNGLVHHWIGTVFIPGTTLAQTLALVQDYNHQSEYYRPRVLTSRILWDNGNDYRVYLRLYEKKVLTCVLDTQHQVHYVMIDSSHAWSRSRSTEIREVAGWGNPGEHDLPIGRDNGYLWRINTYWRFQQKDGGVYVECQSISLTRDIPIGLGWLIGSYVESIPRESLEFTLDTTRQILAKRESPHRLKSSNSH